MELSIENSKNFLEITPLIRRELLAAWDGLSTETIISLLNKIEENEILFDEDREIIEKALTHTNDFIRYLASRWIIERDTEENLIKRFSTDKSDLVKAQVAGKALNYYFATLKDFEELSQAARLIYLVEASEHYRVLGEERGFKAILASKNITAKEISELLIQYTFTIKKKYLKDSDFWNELFIDLWQLLPQMPYPAKWFFVKMFPINIFAERNVFTQEFFDKNLDKINDLAPILFERNDYDFPIFRKLFINNFSFVENPTKRMFVEAFTKLSFSDEEFHEILIKKPELISYLKYSQNLTITQDIFLSSNYYLEKIAPGFGSQEINETDIEDEDIFLDSSFNIYKCIEKMKFDRFLEQVSEQRIFTFCSELLEKEYKDFFSDYFDSYQPEINLSYNLPILSQLKRQEYEVLKRNIKFIKSQLSVKDYFGNYLKIKLLVLNDHLLKRWITSNPLFDHYSYESLFAKKIKENLEKHPGDVLSKMSDSINLLKNQQFLLIQEQRQTQGFVLFLFVVLLILFFIK